MYSGYASNVDPPPPPQHRRSRPQGATGRRAGGTGSRRVGSWGDVLRAVSAEERPPQQLAVALPDAARSAVALGRGGLRVRRSVVGRIILCRGWFGLRAS